MFTYKVDDRITLELPQNYHAAELGNLVVLNLDHLKPWMPWAVENYSVTSALDFIQRNLNAFAKEGSFNALIRYDGKLAGTIGFHSLDLVNNSANIGYWISKEFEGRGIITNCCRSLIDHLFNVLELNRVQINCNIENARSRAVPERLGFTLEGIQRDAEKLQDRYGDWAIYSLLIDEWSANKKI